MPSTPEVWRNLGQVNNTDNGAGADNENDQFDPKVIQLTNGNFIIAWVSNTDSGAGANPGDDIIGEIYDSRGNVIKSEFRLNTGSFSSDENQFDMAALPSGGFVVTYIDQNNASDRDVRLTEWNAAGTVSSDTLIAADNNDSSYFRNPNVAVSSNSSVMISYEEVNSDNDAVSGDVDVLTKVYNSTNNTVGAQSVLLSGLEGAGEGVSGNSVAALSNGNYVVVSGNNNPAPTDDSIIFNIRTAAGGGGPSGTVSTGFDFNQDPHVVALTGGGFVVVWETDGTDNSGNSGVRARVYTNAGVGSPTIVPATTLGGDQSNAVVAALDDGGFVIAWVDQDTRDIHGQRFNSAGTKVGAEFDIDTNFQERFNPEIDIEGLDDGRFVVTWEEGNQTGTIPGPFGILIPIYDGDVRAQIFDPRDNENSPNDYTTDQVVGTIGNDVINISSADDQVYGWNGNDRFNFNSVFDSNNGDIFDGGTGTDTIEIQGNITMNFQGANFTSFEEVEFDAGANQTKTAIFAASEVGAGLSNSLLVDFNANGSNAPDTLRFVMGFDTFLNLGGFTFQDVEEFDHVEVIGDGNAETIFGTSIQDVIRGNGGNDTINANGGNDSVNGGAGNDSMNGGTGIDLLTYAGAASAVTVNLGFAGPQNTLGAGVDTLSNFENLTGSSFSDTLIGNGGNNVIDGSLGNDLLIGGGGNDELIGGFSTDNLQGGTGNDILNGGFGNDTMDGGGGIDTAVYSGFGGSVVVNLSTVGAQNTGAGGIDTISNIENLIGADFNDRLTGTTGANTIEGGLGADRVFGLGGNDTLNGGGGNDNIQGGAGTDIITGGAGRDIMRGGTGNDIFVIGDISDTAVGGLRDRIDNFSVGGANGNETVDLSGIDAIAGGGDDAFTWLGLGGFTNTAGELRYFTAPGPRRIAEGDVDGDGVADFQVEFFNLNISLIASDFVL